ncbi:MAG: hypothetical protein ACXVPQ_08325 [Bacteroidia bacterium]
MKKHYFIFCFASFLFICCKKEYTCDCKITWTHFNGSNSVTTDWPGTSESFTKKMTKKEAQSACDHEQSAILTNFMNAFTDNGNESLPEGEKFSSSCSLK